MLYLIWSITNGIILLYFLYLIIGFLAKGKRIFKPQFKLISICIMVIGIVQIISASNSEKNTNQIQLNKNYNKQSNSKIKKVVLEDNLTFDIYMDLIYSVDKNEFVPIKSNSSLAGLVSGYEWEFKSIQTSNYEPNQKIGFVANGVLKWNLFGITVYNQSKIFEGIIEYKKL